MEEKVLKELEDLSDEVSGFYEADGSSDLEDMGLGAPDTKDEGVEYDFQDLKDISENT